MSTTTTTTASTNGTHDTPITPGMLKAMAERRGDVLTWPMSLQLSHTGDAARFAARYGAKVRYTVGRGWLVWDGKRFAEDVNNSTVTRYMQDVARDWFDDGMRENVEEARKPILKHAGALLNRDALAKALDVASKKAGILTRDDEFDADPLALNCLNGILDLRDGTLAPHDPTRMCSRLASVAYYADAPATRWQRFKHEIYSGDTSMVTFDRMWDGYCLTGMTHEHKYYIAIGGGTNGKSTKFDALRHVMGDYCTDISVSALAAKREASNLNPDLARLPGARLAICPEWDEDMRADESMLKSLIGGDYLLVRTLYQKPFSFKPQTKIVIYGNHKPQLRGSDNGTWRRPLLVPYTESFKGREDRGLTETLAAEGEGILADMARGCMEWLRTGLVIPQAITTATEQYRQDSNDVLEFIKAMCITDSNARYTVGKLQEAYSKWGGAIRTSQKFGRALREAGYATEKTRNGYEVIGLGLAND